MSVTSRRCLIESFARAFSKARRLVMFSQKTHDEGTCARSNTSRSAVALRRGRNNPILLKRHEGVNVKPKAWQRGNTQVGVPPYPIKPFQIACPLFLLAEEAQKKKLGKKKSACRKFRACERDQRSARWISGRFLEKATEKLSNWLRH